jgi:hypothetical protein
LTAAQIRATADAVCARRNRELRRFPLGGAGLAATASDASQRALIERHALGELSALKPPPGGGSPWEAMILQTKLVLAEVTKLAQAAHAGDDVAVRKDLAAAVKPQFRLLAAAAETGTRHCTVVG